VGVLNIFGNSRLQNKELFSIYSMVFNHEGAKFIKMHEDICLRQKWNADLYDG